MSRLQYFRIASILGAFLVGFWLPVRLIGFVPSVALECIFDLIISFVSGINIYLHFSEKPNNAKDPRAWLNAGVLLDILCMMPLALVAFAFFDRTLEWVLLFNLLSARHIYKIRSFLDGFDNLQPIVYRLIPLVITLPLLVHLVACGWIALGSGNIGPDPDQLLTYVKAVYWTFTTLTTVGYGDITAKSIAQMLYSCGIQVIGVGVFGFILSNVAGLLARSDAAREHHMDNLDKIETFMSLHQTPAELRSKIRAYYHYLWINKKGYQDQALLEGLPNTIQSELFLHINRSIIEKVPFLRGADRELLTELMNELKPRIFVPGERIFRAGDEGDSLYFIHSGEVEILNPNNTVIATISDGSFFGEMALISEAPRSATVKATSFCDLYYLSRQSFQKVTASHPSFREHIEEVMRERTAA